MSRARISTWIVAALAVGALSGACGGAGASGNDGVASASRSGSAKNASAKNQADPQQAGLDFARCMREHGVDVPDPESGQSGFAVRIDGSAGAGGGDSAPSVQAAGPGGPIDVGDNGAFEACRHFLDDAIANSDRQPDPQMADRALKFAQCMRDHGVDMPDPQVNGGMVAIQIGNGVDPSSPTLQAAQEACKDLMGPPGGGATKGGPGIGFSTATAKS